MIQYIQHHLSAKLVGGVVLAVTSESLLPASFNRHMARFGAPNTTLGPGQGMGMGHGASDHTPVRSQRASGSVPSASPLDAECPSLPLR